MGKSGKNDVDEDYLSSDYDSDANEYVLVWAGRSINQIKDHKKSFFTKEEKTLIIHDGVTKGYADKRPPQFHEFMELYQGLGGPLHHGKTVTFRCMEVLASEVYRLLSPQGLNGLVFHKQNGSKTEVSISSALIKAVKSPDFSIDMIKDGTLLEKHARNKTVVQLNPQHSSSTLSANPKKLARTVVSTLVQQNVISKVSVNGSGAPNMSMNGMGFAPHMMSGGGAPSPHMMMGGTGFTFMQGFAGPSAMGMAMYPNQQPSGIQAFRQQQAARREPPRFSSTASFATEADRRAHEQAQKTQHDAWNLFGRFHHAIIQRHRQQEQSLPDWVGQWYEWNGSKWTFNDKVDYLAWQRAAVQAGWNIPEVVALAENGEKDDSEEESSDDESDGQAASGDENN